jgi:hypothetical protein
MKKIKKTLTASITKKFIDNVNRHKSSQDKSFTKIVSRQVVISPFLEISLLKFPLKVNYNNSHPNVLFVKAKDKVVFQKKGNLSFLAEDKDILRMISPRLLFFKLHQLLRTSLLPIKALKL